MKITKLLRHPLFVLSLLVIIFIGPFFAAWVLFKEKSTQHEKTVHYGQLITPPLDLQTLKLFTNQQQLVSNKDKRGKWLLVYFEPDACTVSCEKALYALRQIQKATGKESTRITRVIITLTDNKPDPHLEQWLTSAYSGTLHWLVQKNALAAFLQPLPSTKLAFTQGRLYLSDPLGNVMMEYPVNADPNKLYRDLNRLLKVSQIG